MNVEEILGMSGELDQTDIIKPLDDIESIFESDGEK